MSNDPPCRYGNIIAGMQFDGTQKSINLICGWVNDTHIPLLVEPVMAYTYLDDGEHEPFITLRNGLVAEILEGDWVAAILTDTDPEFVLLREVTE